MTAPRAKQVADRLLVGLFLAAVWLPLIGQTFAPDRTAGRQEKRQLAPLPHLAWTRASIAAFPRAFEAYYNDHFGFRSFLIREHIRLRFSWLGSLSDTEVLVGKDGWLYFRGAGAMDYYSATSPLSAKALEGWQRCLEERRDWLAERDAAYLVVFVPIKPTIYPEHLPDSIQRLREDSRLDQLMDYLRARSDLHVLDLRDALLAAKAEYQVYYRTDSHWNELGAYVGYRRIVEALQKILPLPGPLPLSSFRVDYRTRPGGDLATMVGMRDTFSEKAPHLTPIRPWRVRPEQAIGYSTLVEAFADTYGVPAPEGGEQAVRKRAVLRRPSARDRFILAKPDLYLYMAVEKDDDRLPTAVVFHDSFTAERLYYFLSDDFRRIVFLWNETVDAAMTFDTALVERERPDVVIHEMAERVLMSDPPANNECLPPAD